MSALGCGAYKHPPEEVALLFREEIDEAGDDHPFIVFAILDDHNSYLAYNPSGNFEVFNRILNQRTLEANRQDLPEGDSLADWDVEETGGPGATLPPGPYAQGGGGSDDAGGDHPMGS
jgi:hypothetical protein